MMRTEGTYFARTEHGGHRVLADNDGFSVFWPHGAIRYPSARQTIMALVNQSPNVQSHHRDPKITFDRYFRRGRFRRQSEPTFDTLRLFRSRPDITVAKPKARIRTSEALSVTPTVRGIDLAKRGHEVRKLFYAGYGRRVIKYGYDPDDVLQEVYKGLLVRNQGKCPFDPSKSSFGHYVHMVCGCIVSNYRRRYSRLERNEQFGVLNYDNELEDVANSDLAVTSASQEDTTELSILTSDLTALVVHRVRTRGMDSSLAGSVIDFVCQGYRKSEIVDLTGSTPNIIARMLRMIREVTAEWRGFTYQ